MSEVKLINRGPAVARVYGSAFDDANGTPFRCVECGVAVRIGRGDPCACTAAAGDKRPYSKPRSPYSKPRSNPEGK